MCIRDSLTIDGVAALHPARHEVITDRVVSATYLAAGLISACLLYTSRCV